MTPTRGHAIEPESAPVEVKGSMFRSLALMVAAHPQRAAIAAGVSAKARDLLEDPPLPTAWIDARLINEIYEVMRVLLGDTELRQLNRTATERGVSPIVRGAAEWLIRVFGASPATLLGKFDRVAGTTSRGVVYRYEERTDTTGYFDIEYPALRDVPMGPFVATAGALELVFDICGVQGTMTGLAVVPNGRHNRVRYDVVWGPLRRK